MSVKFKLGFTIDAETLFLLMSKMLPIENLSVEEVVEQPAPPAERLSVSQVAKAFHLPKRNKWRKRISSRHPNRPNFKTGINGVITRHLSDGMGHPLNEFRQLLKAAGYSQSSVSSRMEELHKHGVVENIGGGAWRLTNKYLPQNATTEAGQE